MKIGVDLGGTKTAAGLVDTGGNIVERVSLATDKSGGEDSVINRIIGVCNRLIENTEAKVESIGVGVPGHANDKTGEVIFTPNLPLLRSKMVDKINSKINIPVFIGNDANCAALGESVAGSLAGAQSGVFVIIGTGIGGGIIIDGKLYTGLSGAAGEFGHVTIAHGGRKCGCGMNGCWEAYSNSAGLAQFVGDAAKSAPDSKLWELCKGKIKKTDGRAIFSAFRDGDKAAVLGVERYIDYLAVGISNIINFFEPEIISLGGGISNAFDCFEELLNNAITARKFARFSVTENIPQTKIVRATLGDDAGIIGAANLGG